MSEQAAYVRAISVYSDRVGVYRELDGKVSRYPSAPFTIISECIWRSGL